MDLCKGADIDESENGSPQTFDDSSCHASGTIPPFNEYLNVNAPLQIGGYYVDEFEASQYGWQYKPIGKSFDGCIRNIVHNSKVRYGNIT